MAMNGEDQNAPRGGHAKQSVSDVARTQSSPALGHSLIRNGSLECYRELVEELWGKGCRRPDNIDAEFVDEGFSRINMRDWIAMFEWAALEKGCTDFGLRLAALECERLRDNPFTLAISNAATLAESLQLLLRNARIVGADFGINVRRAPGSDWVSLEIDPRLNGAFGWAQIIEYGLCTFYKRLSDIAERPISCEIWFPHKRISSLAVYARYLPVPLRFDKPVGCLRIRGRDLDQPISIRSAAISKLAEYYIASRFRQRTPQLRDRAEQIALELLARGSFTLDDLAARFRLNARTFQRRLNEEGSSFHKVKEGARRQLALRYLANREIPLKEVAHRLGYSESSALTRSCQKWFFATPRDLRGRLNNE